MYFHRLWAGGGALLLAVATNAQDLTWTEMETAADPPQPATAVKMTGRVTPSVPKEIKKLSEIAYADVSFITDAKGKGLVRIRSASNPWLLQAVDQSLREYKISPLAPQNGTTPYFSTRCYLIYNPASAGVRLADSTPRALAVHSAVLPVALLKKDRKDLRGMRELQDDIWVDVSVDAAGRISDVVPVAIPDTMLAVAAVAAVKQWQFAPARQGGIPVAAKVRVPVLFKWPDLFSPSDLSKPPHVIKQTRPEYPMSERRKGFRGEVLVDFVVTSNGDVNAAHVYQSNNPNFNDPALDAVRQWKFEPGVVGGRSVNTRMRVPMVFSLNGIEASERYETSGGKSSKLPPELQNEYPPRVKNAALGVYPFAQLEKGAHATVTVKFAVRPDGKVAFTDEQIQSSSDFDSAARAMIEEFEFVPASKDGKPNWGLLKMEVKFESDSEQVPVSSSARSILRELREKEPAIFLANQVDQKPETVVSHKPVFPSNLLGNHVNGEAMIEFFIDEAGMVQLPRVVSASHPSFGYAGAQALSQWRFKPLTHGGKPAIVRVRMPFVFSTDS